MKKKTLFKVTVGIIILAVVLVIVLAVTLTRPAAQPIPMKTTPTPTTQNNQNQTPPEVPNQSANSGRPPITTTVDIANFAFSQPNLNLHIGDRVVWTNFDTAQHTVTSDSGSELNSGPISKGQTYVHTFNTTGTFKYHCTFHPNMQATIIIS